MPNNFSVMASWALTCTMGSYKCLAQGHSMVEVGNGSRTSQSRVLCCYTVSLLRFFGTIIHIYEPGGEKNGFPTGSETGTESIRTQVNSYSFKSIHTHFWSIRTHLIKFSQLVLILVNWYS